MRCCCGAGGTRAERAQSRRPLWSTSALLGASEPGYQWDARVSGTPNCRPDVLADLAKGTLRKKLPALQGRFTHHALLVSQMLAQIDFLDETIATLSAQIEELTRPFSRELELLDTIPGVDRRAAEMLLAEIGPDMSRCPDRRSELIPVGVLEVVQTMDDRDAYGQPAPTRSSFIG